ncbi:MAG: M1 family metallopeptidase [Eubacterium sp.]|nr:M1 family metallopeptidase [Eubacterium sp.]
MKKPFRKLLVLLLAAAMTAGLAGCGAKCPIDLSTYEYVDPSEHTCYPTSYTMELTLDVPSKTVSGNALINIQNLSDDTLDKLCLRFWPASIYPAAAKMGASAVEKITDQDGKALTFTNEDGGSILWVDISGHPLAPGESGAIDCTFKTKIPDKMDRCGFHIDGDLTTFQLSYFYPMLSMYQDGEWDTHPYIYGDPTYNPVTAFYVTFTAPEEYTVVASGQEETHNGITSIYGGDMREMAIVACNKMKVISEEVDGVTVNHYGFDVGGKDQYEATSLASGVDCVKLYTETFGPYPYDELDLVEAFNDGGMEYPGLLMLGIPEVDDLNQIMAAKKMSNLCLLNAHEIGHEWFYGCVGDNPFTDAWLDEGFAYYCEEYLFPLAEMPSMMEGREFDRSRHITSSLGGFILDGDKDELMASYMDGLIHGADTYYIDKPSFTYGNWSTYYEHVYEGGLFFLYELEKAMGSDAFHAFLKDWYTEHSLKIVTTRDFIYELLAVDHSEAVQAVLTKYLSTYTEMVEEAKAS